jgi:outer membrane protein assembly factor BamB
VSIQKTPPSTKVRVVAVNRNTGAVVWQGPNFTDGGTRCLTANTEVVVGVEDSNDLVARRLADGVEVWRYASTPNQAGYPISAPAMSADGSIVYVSAGWRMRALDAETGQLLLSSGTFGASNFEGPPIVGEGFVALTLGLDRIVTNGSGLLIWNTSDLGFAYTSSNVPIDAVAIGSTLVYAAGYTNKIISLNPSTGVERWSYSVADDLIPVGLAATGGKIYADLRCAECNLGRVVALDGTTGIEAWISNVTAPSATSNTKVEALFVSSDLVVTRSTVLDRYTGSVINTHTFPTMEVAIADGVLYRWVTEGAQKRLVAEADLYDSPNTPTNVVSEVVAVDSGRGVQLKVSWDPASTNLRQPIDSYIVTDGSGVQLCEVTDVPTSCLFWANWDSTYIFAVQSKNSKGLSLASVSDPLVTQSRPATVSSGVVAPPTTLDSPTRASCSADVSTGVSINDGSAFTNQKNVTLTLTFPECVTEVLISNDGGFNGISPTAPKKTLPWELDDRVSGKLTKVVYVRLVGPGIDSSQTYSDDIILDTISPQLIFATASSSRSLAASSTRFSVSTKAVSVVIKSKAKDDRSGVSKIQISGVSVKGSSTKSYAKSVKYEVASAKKSPARIQIRVQDGAGNWSKWKVLSLRK